MIPSTQFYEVNIQMSPWNQPAKSLGFYSTESLAERVASFVRDTFMGDFAGGIGVGVENRLTKNEIKKMGEKIGFVETSNPDRMGALYTISKELDREEVIRIVDFISNLKEMNQKDSPFKSHPISLEKSSCYVMYKNLIDDKPLGVYSSQHTLMSAIHFCSLMNIDYDFNFERRDVVVFDSGHAAVFMPDESLMRVTDQFDLIEVKRIINRS